jgi:citrate lyase subunit beta/citryl-CoA lyase
VTERLRRSELSTPGSSEKMLGKAAASAADLVFCDLEDSVAPPQKEGARTTVVASLTQLDWGHKTKAVRINGVHTDWWRGDVIAAAQHAEVIIIPKVRTPDDVQSVDVLISQTTDRAVALEVLIEEAEGLVNVEDIAHSSDRLEALIFGPGDFSASQGVRFAMAREANYPGDIWAYHRSRIVVAARAAGIDAIDGPFANFRDADGYRTEAARAAMIGFVGKWAIHPSQIEIANDVFSPKPEELVNARAIIEAYENSDGAAGVGGMMIDAATARIMEGILRRAEMIQRAETSS